MLDYEEVDALPNMLEMKALDNGHLYAWGQREFCSVGEWVLAERFRDALDIIEILSAQCQKLSTNEFAYAGTWDNSGNEHSVKLAAADEFVITGVMPIRLLLAPSDWRKGKS